MSLYRRVLVPVLGIVAVALALLALSPATVSYPVSLAEAVLLAVVLVICAVAIGWSVRGALVPLRELTARVHGLEASQVPYADPLPIPTDPDLAALTGAYNNLLERVGRAQELSALAGLRAQEKERARIGHELHDEIGQGLTFLVLRLDALGKQVDGPSAAAVAQTREVARDLLDDVRRLSSQLRPGALADLGLATALRSLAQETRSASGIPVDAAIEDPGVLDEDAQLVAYRVAQEALTNAVRHAAPTRIRLCLDSIRDGVLVEVSDDGVGGVDETGSGVRGMRTRATAVHARLTITEPPEGGTVVRLEIPRTR